MLAFTLAACSLLCLALAFIMAAGMVFFPVANVLLGLAPCLGIAAMLTASISLCRTTQRPWWNVLAFVAAAPSLLFMGVLARFLSWILSGC